MNKGLALVALVLGCGDVLDGGTVPLSGGHTPDVVSMGSASCRGSGMPVNVSTLVSGDGHTCTIGPAGDVYCWGRNDLGQLGQGHVMPRGGIWRVLGLEASAVALDTGRNSTCALLDCGAVACWGYGATSTGVDPTADGPAAMVFDGASALATHDERVCAVLGDGQVWCQTMPPRREGEPGRSPIRLDAAPADTRSIAMHSDKLAMRKGVRWASTGSSAAGVSSPAATTSVTASSTVTVDRLRSGPR